MSKDIFVQAMEALDQIERDRRMRALRREKCARCKVHPRIAGSDQCWGCTTKPEQDVDEERWNRVGD